MARGRILIIIHLFNQKQPWGLKQFEERKKIETKKGPSFLCKQLLYNFEIKRRQKSLNKRFFAF